MADTTGTTHKYAKRTSRPEVKAVHSTRFHNIWQGMLSRCNCPSATVYSYYGGRGIKVCQRWQESFQNFYDDMYATYQEDLTLDRRDNTKDYGPDNCRWATKKEQALNTRNIERAKRYTYKGETKTIREWAEHIGIKRTTLDMRLNKYNWTLEKALGGTF